MNKLLIALALFIILCSCSDNNQAKAYKEHQLLKPEITSKGSDDSYSAQNGYISAFEGYQFVKKQMKMEGYDTSYIHLINIALDCGAADLITAGNDIGKANQWNYYISYNKKNEDKYFWCWCICEYGEEEPTVDVYSLDKKEIVEEYGTRPKYLNITKENDSPAFIKKLTTTTNFLESVNDAYSETNHDAYISFSYYYPNKESYNNFELYNFQFNEKLPYWIVLGRSKACILLADKKIFRNNIDCFDIINDYIDDDDDN